MFAAKQSISVVFQLLFLNSSKLSALRCDSGLYKPRCDIIFRIVPEWEKKNVAFGAFSLLKYE